MLRINQNTHPVGAKSYYSTADYYSEGQELTGRWRGAAAAQLGLTGNVQQKDWDALCDNRHPQSGMRLTPRTKADRTVGYDFNFHVPKSVSLLYSVTRDERLLDAFRDAVDGTMHDMEAEISTRVRKGQKNENRTTGNMVWGEFVHFTTRPIDGVPDPHLHAHCFVFNTTWDEKEHSWKAAQFQNLKRDAPYFEAVFHSRLTYRLAELGLPIERTAKGWELAGVGKGLVDKFSRRTAEIERKAKEKGIEDPDAKSELGAKTRQRKAKGLSFPELQDRWNARMSPQERDVLAALEHKIGGDAAPPDDTAAARALEHAVRHAFERRSVVPERQLLAAALKHGVGRATVEQVHAKAAGSDLVVGQRRGRRMVTTREVLKEERRVIDFARKGRGSCRPLGRGKHAFRRDWLNEDQKQTVQHILDSRDLVTIVEGAAGVGKTSLMQEAVEAIETGGTKVLSFAPSAGASRGVQREAGFGDADTVARLLVDENLQRQAAGQLIWIDETGQVGTKTMAQVFDLADRVGARVLLTGDRRQHGSVERGAVLRLLEEEAGLVPAEVKEIQRQSGDYKAAVRALSEGNAVEGFDRLDALGWIKQIPVGERYQQLAADYVTAQSPKKTSLVISPTHAEAERITLAIREALHDGGKLGSHEREVTVLSNAGLTLAERGDAVNYHAGDVIQFHQNAKGFRRGERLKAGGERNLPLDQAARFQVFRTGSLQLAPGDLVRITKNGQTADGKHRVNNGDIFRIHHFDAQDRIVLDNGWTLAKDFGHLAYGYVVTSHASQGKTVHNVFIAQSSVSYPATSREQFYVSVSRGRDQAIVYTHNKEALREAIRQSDDRLTATELVKNRLPVQAFRHYQAEVPPKTPAREREELVYDR